MKVHGIEITAKQIMQGLAAMQGSFVSRDIQVALEAAGVPSISGAGWTLQYISSRAADRLLREQKKRGTIKYSKGKWTSGLQYEQT